MEALTGRGAKKHIVILVHGIRTFGAWQDRLADLLHQREPGIEAHIYKYGYFSALAFLIPFLRMIVIRRFRRYLIDNASAWEGARVDIVAHSFGTYVIAWALRRLPVDQSPRIHTIILCGSVLKQLFPWNTLVGRGRPVTQVINECGTKDLWPLIAQLVVFGMGSAGRHGFAGVIGTDVGIVNRYHPVGHSDFFTDAFMSEHWTRLLSGTAPPTGPRLIPPKPGLSMTFENFADPVKILLLSLFLFGPVIGFQYQRLQAANAAADKANAEAALSKEEQKRIGAEADRARVEAARAKEEQRRIEAEADFIRAQADAAIAVAEAANQKLRRQEADLARAKAEREKTDEESRKLLAQAHQILYRAPERSLWLALRAAEISPNADADSTQQIALKILQQRRQTQTEEAKQWFFGQGWFAPPQFTGKLSARFSRDGKYALLPTERSRGNPSLPGIVYLLNNETLKLVRLEPTTQRKQAPKSLDYMGFSNSGRKIYLARWLNIEVYSSEGIFEQEFQLDSSKQSISLVDGVEGDRLIVAGDMTGDVWPIDSKTRKADISIARKEREDLKVEPLVSFELSPSGKLVIMVHLELTRKNGRGVLGDSDYDQNSRAYLWQVGGKGPKSRLSIKHKGSVTYATFKPTREEDVMLTAGEDGVVALWKFENGRVCKVDAFGHGGKPVGYATFSEDGSHVITLADDQKPRVWGVKSGRPCPGSAERKKEVKSDERRGLNSAR